jgi:hypothetical protein
MFGLVKIIGGMIKTMLGRAAVIIGFVRGLEVNFVEFFVFPLSAANVVGDVVGGLAVVSTIGAFVVLGGTTACTAIGAECSGKYILVC